MAEHWRRYPLSCTAYERDSEKGDSLKGKFDAYGVGDPNEQTTYAIGYTEDGENLFEELLTEGQIEDYFATSAENIGNLAVYQFFFNLQPGGANRIYTPCMRKLLSALQISPSFPILVGNAHVTAFGSRLIRNPTDATPQLHETWFAITSPRLWPTASVPYITPEQKEGLFDWIPLPHMGFTLLMWRMSVYIRYNHKDRTVVILGLDEGGQFRENRLPDMMAQSMELHTRENPFSLHLLFLSEALHDWTLCFEALQKEFKKEEAAVFESEHIEYAVRLRRFHQLSAHLLKYQKDVMAFPDVLDGVEKEHNRFQKQVDLPDHLYQRVDENLYRLKQIAWSNQHHSSRMERQIKNIQDMLIHLITLENEISVRKHTEVMQRNVFQMANLTSQNVELVGENAKLASQINVTLNTTKKISEGSSVLVKSMSENVAQSADILRFMETVAQQNKNQSKELMEIAREAREHSGSMKTIAVISMVFLPPTFICTFFSMQAFKFSLPDQGQQVITSPGLWVPLTSCVLVLFATLSVFYYPLILKRWQGKNMDSNDEEEPSPDRDIRQTPSQNNSRRIPGSFEQDRDAIAMEDLPNRAGEVEVIITGGTASASSENTAVETPIVIKTRSPAVDLIDYPIQVNRTQMQLNTPPSSPQIEVDAGDIVAQTEGDVVPVQTESVHPLQPALLGPGLNRGNGSGDGNVMRDAAARRRQFGDGMGERGHSRSSSRG